MRSRAFGVVVVVVVGLVACGDDGDGGQISQVLANERRVFEKVCACSDDDDCEVDEERVVCVTGVLRRHESALNEYFACANDAYLELEKCIDDAACVEDGIIDCYMELGVSTVCEDVEVSDDLDDQIDEEVSDECPSDIECLDNSTVRGSYCNGEAECADASDELGCTSDEPQFTCLNGSEIPASYVCDDFDDCGDNSDENPAQCD